MPNFLTAQEADGLAQEFFIAQRDGKLKVDPLFPESLCGYNLLAAVKTLVKKVPEVSKLCGEDVLPTYVYGRIYGHNEILIKHKDRPSCEISLTVTLQKDQVDWPIWVEKPNGEAVSFNLNAGDAVMYLGCAAAHWREKYEGQMQTQLFMHYVLADGPNANMFFDIDTAARGRR